ncbi:hypothetical protein CIW50_15100 [Tardiphaga sp. P9-11]|nr:hypothetical protein CIW50_15100 [Tardiphaga sp. P9-11]
MGDACLDIASFARERKHEFLSYILRLAAAEAYKTTADEDAFELPMPRRLAAKELIVGIWDWDISNDRSYLDTGSANFFNIDPTVAARGLPCMECLAAVHPDDIARVLAAIDQSSVAAAPMNANIGWSKTTGSAGSSRAATARWIAMAARFACPARSSTLPTTRP